MVFNYFSFSSGSYMDFYLGIGKEEPTKDIPNGCR